jgi:glycosyltransferase involved in cell wall biosynthesis
LAVDVPPVSVILPAFNRPECLSEAVRSVFAQTHQDWELIVADDGSSDETRAYLLGLHDPRARVLWLPHSGNPGRVRNAALKMARGRYLAFLDSDDCWHPAKLERQLQALHSAAECRWSYTARAFMDERGRPLSQAGIAPWHAHQGDILERLLKIEALVVTPSVMAERSLVQEAGGFDEQQRFHEDLDLWLRLAARSAVTVVDQELVRVRSHRDRYSWDRVGDYEGQVRLYGKMADTLTDPKLKKIARRRQAMTTLGLAGLHFDAGRRAEVHRTLRAAASYSWRYPAWWWGAAKAVLRSRTPARVLAVYRDFTRGRACTSSQTDRTARSTSADSEAPEASR